MVTGKKGGEGMRIIKSRDSNWPEVVLARVKKAQEFKRATPGYFDF